MKSPISSFGPHVRRLLGGAGVATSLAVLAGANLSAQSSPEEGAADDVVTLQEFSVTTSATSEYVAAESITGTRVATKLRDLPFTVNVVTSDFLDDFAAFEFREQLSYTSSVVGYETISTGYMVRGVDANVQLRNGFRRIGLIDKVSVERIEVIKGAAASIYGTVMPGGTVNIITKKPKTKPENRIGFSVGSNNLLRGQASSTGPVGSSDKVFYRVDVAADTTEYDLEYKKKDQQTIVGSMLWKLKPTTSLLVEYEYLKRDEIGNASIPFIRSRAVDPYRRQPGDGLTPAVSTARNYIGYDGIATEISDFNLSGPSAFADRYVHTVTATLEHRINEIFSLRSSANWFDRGLERGEFSGRDQYDPTTKTVALGNTRLRPFPEGGASWQTDLLASWRTGPVSHKTLLTFDYQRQTEKPERWDGRTTTVRINGSNKSIPLTYPGAAATIAALPTTVVSGVTYPTLTLPIGSPWMLGSMPTIINYDNFPGLAVANPSYDMISYYDDPSLYNLSQKENNSIDIYGLFLSERATFFDDRVTLLAGARYDYVDSHSKNLVSGNFTERQTDEVSYQAGGNVRVLPSVTAYANASRSFVPDFSAGRDIDGNPFDVPNEIGESWEAGFKVSAFSDRLTFTTTYFDVARENVRREVTDPTTGTIYDTVSGRETSKGYEFDYNWVVTRELQLFGGYGYTDSEIENYPTAPSFEGGPVRRAPKHTLGVGAKYNIKSGRLRGLYFTAGYKYNSKSRPTAPAGRTLTASYNANPASSSYNPIINNPMPNGRLPFPDRPVGDIIGDTPDEHGLRAVVDDGRALIFNDAYELVDVGVGYRWKAARRYGHKIQLNVSNLLDEEYTYGSSGQGARRAYVLSYDLTF